MQTVYLIIGVSGAGKSWVARQLTSKFEYLPHDRCWSHPSAKPKEGMDPKWGPAGSKSTHLPEILRLAKESKKPIITEVPFAERQLKADIESKGIKVIPVFVIEDPKTIIERYKKREGKGPPQSVITRAISIVDRAKEWKAFHGTSDEVLKHLKEV